MLKKIEPGELIFREGDPANSFYLIQQGKVVLESQAGGGRIPVQTVETGEVLGWSWLFPPYYWHFDACAVESTEAIFFMERLCAKNASVTLTWDTNSLSAWPK